MKQSMFFLKTRKNAPRDAVEVSHALLLRGDFIDQLAAGIYTLLPLGQRVHENIVRVVREEMNSLGAQEILMPALHPKAVWERTGRWDAYRGEMYQFQDKSKHWFGLGPTHEEVITALVAARINSFRDLPVALYQIQTKFRDETRPKAGLLRTKEFTMKDLYSFHANREDFVSFYARVSEAYLRIFKRCGLEAIPVEASGGAFTKEITREFMVKTPAGEDITLRCSHCGWAANKEVAGSVKKKCPSCGSADTVSQQTTVEAGHVFHLDTRFSSALGAAFLDEHGVSHSMIMGCYGIGTTRLLATIVEANHDARGIIWPREVAPFDAHMLALSHEKPIRDEAEAVARYLQNEGIEVLYDDRDCSAGEKFADADLLGIPLRVVLSEKTHAQGMVEIKYRNEAQTRLVTRGELLHIVTSRGRAA